MEEWRVTSSRSLLAIPAARRVPSVVLPATSCATFVRLCALGDSLSADESPGARASSE